MLRKLNIPMLYRFMMYIDAINQIIDGDTEIYIVMEHIVGGELFDFID